MKENSNVIRTTISIEKDIFNLFQDQSKNLGFNNIATFIKYLMKKEIIENNLIDDAESKIFRKIILRSYYHGK